MNKETYKEWRERQLKFVRSLNGFVDEKFLEIAWEVDQQIKKGSPYVRSR